MQRTTAFLIMLLLALSGCSARQQSAAMTAESGSASVSGADAYEQGQYASSVASFSARIRENSADHKAFNGRGAALLAMDRAGQALADFNRALSIAPRMPGYHLNAAIALLRLNRPEDALDQAGEALRLQPDFADALLAQGIAFMHLQEYEVALGRINRALVLAEKAPEQNAQSPESALRRSLLYYRGMAQQHVGLFDDAIDDYTDYIALVKSDQRKASAHANRGLCFLEKGDTDRALDDLDAAVVLNPHDAMVYYDRAIVRQRRHELVMAVQDYTRAISREPEFPEAYLGRGEARLVLEQNPQACHDFGRACSMGFCDRLETLQDKGTCE
jgi:tetratricopeptide (TPR) repeat protein